MHGKMMMGGGKGMMGADNAPMSPPEDQADESPSVFLSRQQLGGRKIAKGDTITLTVTDVDPETGDVQADLAGGGATEKKEGAMAAYDRMMPETEEA